MSKKKIIALKIQIQFPGMLKSLEEVGENRDLISPITLSATGILVDWNSFGHTKKRFEIPFCWIELVSIKLHRTIFQRLKKEKVNVFHGKWPPVSRSITGIDFQKTNSVEFSSQPVYWGKDSVAWRAQKAVSYSLWHFTMKNRTLGIFKPIGSLARDLGAYISSQETVN